MAHLSLSFPSNIYSSVPEFWFPAKSGPSQDGGKGLWSSPPAWKVDVAKDGGEGKDVVWRSLASTGREAQGGRSSGPHSARLSYKLRSHGLLHGFPDNKLLWRVKHKS